ncbi:hypothetical protein HN681_01590 [archaeon]|jgi:hypothetical protein|nr:hypothetical protein [archaeon]MBT3731253.1 hypothetical protein [archaeon]MBT4669993.1 hypothetical protein [archaeon]MBT5287805.1 hypothetical protein [archaeon]MBT7053247.1 hypothetical protein [archaeon]
MRKKIAGEIGYLIEEAESKIWQRASDVMLKLYWEIGYLLKDMKEKEVREVSANLSSELSVDKRMFELAYFFHKDNPIMEKAMGCMAS